jgi:hypothetical protein
MPTKDELGFDPNMLKDSQLKHKLNIERLQQVIDAEKHMQQERNRIMDVLQAEEEQTAEIIRDLAILEAEQMKRSMNIQRFEQEINTELDAIAYEKALIKAIEKNAGEQ